MTESAAASGPLPRRSGRKNAAIPPDHLSERSARKRAAILAAAADLFLRQGYLGTSMDEVATRAAVSKQTIYKHFADKQRLFEALVLDAMETADAHIAGAAVTAGDTADAETALRELAHGLLGAMLHPEVMTLRRLVVGEATRFPKLGQLYYQQGFEHGLTTVAVALERLAARGWLALDDSSVAAAHFAGLVLWTPSHRAMFTGELDPPADAEAERVVTAAVHAFLAAYATAPQSEPATVA
jgi:TetR/AcrR family transcriptional repressor of mexJK operon